MFKQIFMIGAVFSAQAALQLADVTCSATDSLPSLARCFCNICTNCTLQSILLSNASLTAFSGTPLHSTPTCYSYYH